MKLKPLMPTLREKKRYMAYEISNAQTSDIINRLQDTLGIFDSAEAGLLEVERNGNKGIIRMAANTVNKVRTALILIDEIKGKQVQPRVLGVSGTMKNARKYMT